MNSNACPRPFAPLLGFLVVTLAMFGCDESSDASRRVNGSVHVPAGRAAGAADTVNGGIDIDANAAVTSAKTVNGRIALGARATAESLTTVNGDINVGAGAHVSGALDSVNGAIILGDGALVGGSLENVNGGIRLSAARVDGGITTVNGNIDIRGDSRVERGIHVQKVDHGLIHFDSRRTAHRHRPGSHRQRRAALRARGEALCERSGHRRYRHGRDGNSFQRRLAAQLSHSAPQSLRPKLLGDCA